MVAVIYSVIGGLAYVGDSRLVTTGGPHPNRASQNNGGMSIHGEQFWTCRPVCETDLVERIIGIELLELGEIYEKKELPVATQYRSLNVRKVGSPCLKVWFTWRSTDL